MLEGIKKWLRKPNEAKWVEKEETKYTLFCSNCNKEVLRDEHMFANPTPYCPFCGAKMIDTTKRSL